MKSISGIQQWHTNQYSLPLRLSLLHLKLRLHGKQMAQHISWNQGCSTSLLISESILQTSTLVWTVPDITLHSFRVLQLTLRWNLIIESKNCISVLLLRYDMLSWLLVYFWFKSSHKLMIITWLYWIHKSKPQ